MAAGKKIYMSQSAVSQQLARLEEELGMVTRLHNDYKEVLAYMNQRMKDHITIGFNCMFDQEVFTTIIQSFQGSSDERVEFKYYDLGKYKEVFAGDMVDAIIRIGFCAGVSLNHPLANRDSIDAHELENEPIVSIGPETREELYREFISSFYRDGAS